MMAFLWVNILAGLILTILLWKFWTWVQVRKLRLPPGPRGLPIIGNLLDLFRFSGLTNDRFYYTLRAKEYGDIYRLKFGSQLYYILCNMDYVRATFNSTHLQHRISAVAFYKPFGTKTHGIAFSDDQNLKEVHQFTMSVFRDLGIKNGPFKINITSEIDRLIIKLDSLLEHPLPDVRIYLRPAISNIICGITFGKQYDYDDIIFKDIISILDTYIKSLRPSAIGKATDFVCSPPFGPIKSVMKCLKRFRAFLGKIIKDHNETFHPDQLPTNFVDAILFKMRKNATTQPTFGTENLLACCMDLFIAGSETIVATMSFAILFLVSHPLVQEKCQKEIDTVLGVDGDPSYSQRSSLPFMQAVIQEIQRLANVAVLGVPHLASCDLKLFGYDVPKGTAVAVNMGSIHMNEAIFESPKEFKPERFIKNGYFYRSPDVIPFSIGNSVCIGEHLASMEIFLLLTRLLQRYTFKATEGTVLPGILEAKTGGTRTPLPFSVTISKRSSIVYTTDQ